jgi:hypothetical protein
MEITNHQHLVGYSWYTVDDNGHLAIFSNAGVGEIPACLKQSKARYEEMVDAWDNYVETRLPRRGSAVVGIITPGASKTMERQGLTLDQYGGDARRDAERGFFVYDAELDHRSPYYSKFLRLFMPKNPLHLSDIEREMRSRLLVVQSHVLFMERDIFSSEEIVSLFSYPV